MATRSGGGAKLNRTEVVTVRFDPKLRFALEMGARKQRRTASSFIEWAVEQALTKEPFYLDGNWEGGSLLAGAYDAWDVDEADRFVKLTRAFPELLTFEEQVLWKLIEENGALWLGRWVEGVWRWRTNYEDLLASRLREKWELFKKVAAGDADKNELPTWKTIGGKDSGHKQYPVSSFDEI